MQNEHEDELVDYNDDPEYVAKHGQPPSHTPPQTPIALNDENEGDENRPEYDATSSTEESRSRVGGYERVVHEIDVAPQNGRDIAAVER